MLIIDKIIRIIAKFLNFFKFSLGRKRRKNVLSTGEKYLYLNQIIKYIILFINLYEVIPGNCEVNEKYPHVMM